jgi:hypothetical protein
MLPIRKRLLVTIPWLMTISTSVNKTITIDKFDVGIMIIVCQLVRVMNIVEMLYFETFWWLLTVDNDAIPKIECSTFLYVYSSSSFHQTYLVSWLVILFVMTSSTFFLFIYLFVYTMIWKLKINKKKILSFI